MFFKINLKNEKENIMKLHFLKYSTLSLISVLSLMSDASAQLSGWLRINYKNLKDISLESVIFSSDYSIPISHCIHEDCGLLDNKYPEIKISTRYNNNLSYTPCSPSNITVNEHTRLIMTIEQPYENRPDNLTCTIAINPM